MDVEGFTHSEGLLGGELHAAQAPLIMRFDKARKQLGGRRPFTTTPSGKLS